MNFIPHEKPDQSNQWPELQNFKCWSRTTNHNNTTQGRDRHHFRHDNTHHRGRAVKYLVDFCYEGNYMTNMLYVLRKISELDFIPSRYTGTHLETNVCPITITWWRLRLMGYHRLAKTTLIRSKARYYGPVSCRFWYQYTTMSGFYSITPGFT